MQSTDSGVIKVLIDPQWAKYEVQQNITEATIDCLKEKCINADSAKYISPQELICYLPPSLGIDRMRHVIKHRSGQWEIKNKNIHCYLGFSMVSNDSEIKQLLRDLQRKKAAKYRSEKKQTEWDSDEKSGFRDTGDCMICGQSQMNTHPGFGRHICRVSGYFQCKYYKCNGHSFRVGICLLDPVTKMPPSRYKCSHCDYVAKFVRYDLNQHDKKVESAPHRSDLCEACDIWGDCQKPFLQPSDISDSLWNFYDVESEWTMNEKGDGVYCSFSMPSYKSEIGYKFEIKPYVNCVRINVKAYCAENNDSDSSNSGGNNTYNIAIQFNDHIRSQKYENPPPANVENNEVECYRCGEIGHFARDCAYDEKDEYDEEHHEQYDEQYDEEYDVQYNEEYDRQYDEEYNGQYDNHNEEHDEQYHENYDEEYDGQYDEEYDEQYNEEYNRQYDEEYNGQYDNHNEEYDEEYDEGNNEQYDDEPYNDQHINEEWKTYVECVQCGEMGHFVRDCGQIDQPKNEKYEY